MARTALRSVGDAIEATRSFLVPSSVRRIAALALVALFLGTPGTPIPANPQFADPRFWEVSDPAAAADGDAGGSIPDGLELAAPATWPTWLLAAVGVALALLAAYLLLGTLARFVLVEALRSGEVRIRRDGRRHLRGALQVLGLRIAVWALAIPAVAIATLAIVGAGPLAGADSTVAAGVLGILAIVVLLVAWAIEVLTLQFVVPTMIADAPDSAASDPTATDAQASGPASADATATDVDASRRGVLAGWRRFWRVLGTRPVEYLLYGVVRVLLGVAVGIAASVAILVVLALAGIVLGTIAAIVVVAAGGVGSLGTVSITTLGVLVAIFVLVGLVTTALVAVPFQCYLWIYALLVLGDTDPELDLIPELRAETRDDEPVTDSA